MVSLGTSVVCYTFQVPIDSCIVGAQHSAFLQQVFSVTTHTEHSVYFEIDIDCLLILSNVIALYKR
jgi:hypothetical protein